MAEQNRNYIGRRSISFYPRSSESWDWARWCVAILEIFSPTDQTYRSLKKPIAEKLVRVQTVNAKCGVNDMNYAFRCGCVVAIQGRLLKVRGIAGHLLHEQVRILAKIGSNPGVPLINQGIEARNIPALELGSISSGCHVWQY